MADATAFSGPLTVTLAYLALYYGFQLNVYRVKVGVARAHHKRGEKFDRYFTQDRELLAADRMQLNTLEHMPPFLILMWLVAVFVGPQPATIAGAVYLAARAYYPLVLGTRLGGGIKPKILLSTGVGYGVLVYLAGALVMAMLG